MRPETARARTPHRGPKGRCPTAGKLAAGRRPESGMITIKGQGEGFRVYRISGLGLGLGPRETVDGGMRE